MAVQLVVARHIHVRLALDDLRDVRLVVLLMEVESGRLAGRRNIPAPFPYSAEALSRLAGIGGISRARVSTVVTRLMEAGALTLEEGPDPRLVFVERLLQPAGSAEYLDWPSVVNSLHGHTPALLVLRSVLDYLQSPSEWVSVTYHDLAERSSYSVGMVRYGIDQLAKAGVLERRMHAGRGHEYRCTAWALGRSAIGSTTSLPVGDLVESLPSPPGLKVRDPEATPPSSITTGSIVAGQVPAADEVPAAVTVQVGDVIVQVPAGTVIRMQVTSDGATVYHVGPHLRLTPRPLL
jgi:hypothetical protein